MYFGQYTPFSSFTPYGQNFAPNYSPALGAPLSPIAPFAHTGAPVVNPLELSLIHQRLDHVFGQLAFVNESIRRLSLELAVRLQQPVPGFQNVGLHGGTIGNGGNVVGFGVGSQGFGPQQGN